MSVTLNLGNANAELGNANAEIETTIIGSSKGMVLQAYADHEYDKALLWLVEPCKRKYNRTESEKAIQQVSSHFRYRVIGNNQEDVSLTGPLRLYPLSIDECTLPNGAAIDIEKYGFSLFLGRTDPFLLQETFSYVEPSTKQEIITTRFRVAFGRINPFTGECQSCDNTDRLYLGNEQYEITGYSYFRWIDHDEHNMYKKSKHKYTIIKESGKQARIGSIQLARNELELSLNCNGDLVMPLLLTLPC